MSKTVRIFSKSRLKKDKLITIAFHILMCFTFVIFMSTQWQFLVPFFHTFTTNEVENQERLRARYLSYQPPVGGWNNQRIAFENALIMALLLKRTLLVQPLAAHGRQIELKSNHSTSYDLYNMLSIEDLVPLSKLIDLKTLSSFLPVEEVSTTHLEFFHKYRNFSWYKVCHNGLRETWVDEMHPTLNIATLVKRKRKQNIPKYRQICPEKKKSSYWIFLNELQYRNEDIIYFENGSLFSRRVYFTNARRALKVEKAVLDWIRPSPEVLHNVRRVLVEIGRPFNAIHVRRTDHKRSRMFSVNHWLSQLARKKALKRTKMLYIATDETNYTWFFPLKKAGYQLLFAKDFAIFRDIMKTNKITGQDILGYHEQIVCSRALVFIGSSYSTFSSFIKRTRAARYWDWHHFQNLKFLSAKLLSIHKTNSVKK